MESLNVYKNSSYKEYKYPSNISAILLAEYVGDGYFTHVDEDAVLMTERQAALSAAIGRLRPREKYVITCFSNALPGQPWLSELANAMGVSELRIKQIKDRALWKLRYHLRKSEKVSLWLEEEEV